MKKIENHKCFKLLNDVLKGENTQLKFVHTVNLKNGAVMLKLPVWTEKIDSKVHKPVKPVLASCCPFCGEKLEKVKEETFTLATARNMLALTQRIMQMPLRDRKVIADELNSMLDELGADDVFGTERQNDPRGDPRG